MGFFRFDKIKIEKLLKGFIFITLLALIFLIFSQKIEFTSLDLGRYLENGKVIWQNPQLLYTNFYSYTETNFPFINHHWLTGLVFYGIYLLGGFKLLSLFNILLALSTFTLVFYLAIKKSNFYLSGFLALPVIFLLSQRVSIRPEAFSYLFIILTYLIIERVSHNRNYRSLNWLIPLFILWVNLHIYFFIGLALLFFKALAEFLPPLFRHRIKFKNRWLESWRSASPWIRNFILLTALCLINPNTWRGLLYPFNILRHYGYQIAGNKTIFYLGHLMINYNFIIFKFLLLLLVCTWVVDWLITKRLSLFPTFLMLFFSGLGLFASRNISLFGLIALILISHNLLSLENFLKHKPKVMKLIKSWSGNSYLALILILFIIISFIIIITNFASQQNFIENSFGWSLVQGANASQRFFKTNNLSGPIFNNYDLGSALIFWLYPQEKVFVDNRPEAYPVEFFKDVYKPMQNNPLVWKSIDAQYRFKTIYFAYTDSTPWAQKFLHFILNNRNWALVYFDRYTIILVNKKLTPSDKIKRLSLDNSTFRKDLRVLVKHSDVNEKFNLAYIAQEANQIDLAQVIYQNILSEFPNNRRALFAMGALYSSYQNKVDLQAALIYFNRARQAGYELPGVYDQSALVYWRLNNYSQAIANWHSALDLNSHDRSALYYLQQVKSLHSTGELTLIK